MMCANAELQTFGLFIDGKVRAARSGQTFESVNPYTGTTWAIAADGGAEDVDDAVNAARAALDGEWGAMTGFDRARIMRACAAAIEANVDRLATLEVNDNGKLMREMRGQASAIAQWFYYFAGLADKIEGRAVPLGNPAYFGYTRREPVGVVAAITPWNSPLMLLTWKLAPLLAAGNTCIVKPSEHTPAATVAFAEILHEAGLPAGVLNVVTSWDRSTGEALTNHNGINKVAFTGSTAAGISVAKAAAANLNRATLELGGKSAHLVFPDADLDAVANGVVAGVFAAAGQTCMAGSRLIVHKDVFEPLVERVVSRARQIKLGDPMHEDTEMGPVANGPQYHRVIEHLERAAAEGGEFRCGGVPSDEGEGLFVLPTVVVGLGPESSLVQQEVFGPVVAAYRFTDEDEAVRLANDTEFGLAGAVWTKDVHRAHRVAAAMRAGTVWINAYRVISPAMPFGGFDSSGLGRESGIEALNEYTETKSIFVELTGGTRDPFMIG